MNWIKNTKRGSILVEAALVLPLFILSMVMLASLIPVTGICENIMFSACDEMRKEGIKAVLVKNPAGFDLSTENRIKRENREVTRCSLSAFPYMYGKQGIKDLITLKGTVLIEKHSLFNLYGKKEYDLHLTGRAFTGQKENMRPMARSEFERNGDAEPVCVFPDYGEKYHKKSCSYVKASCRRTFLNDKVKRKYRPCKLCHSEEAEEGSPVYVFSGEGEHYHLGSCKQVERSFIEMEKREAEEKGYTPCYKCGG